MAPFQGPAFLKVGLVHPLQLSPVLISNVSSEIVHENYSFEA